MSSRKKSEQEKGKLEIPMGLNMALAKNPDAMAHFSSLTQEGKQGVIEHTHQIYSKKEMEQYVNSFTEIKESN